MERVAGCAYTCEMTHGYENAEFLDTIKCLVNNKCLIDYPRDGICHGEDKDGIKNLKSLEQVRYAAFYHKEKLYPSKNIFGGVLF